MQFNCQLAPFPKAFLFNLKTYIVLLLWQLDRLLAMHIKKPGSEYVTFPGRLLVESEMSPLAKLWRKSISFGGLMTLKNSKSVYKEGTGGNTTYEHHTVTMTFLCLFGSIIWLKF